MMGLGVRYDLEVRNCAEETDSQMVLVSPSDSWGGHN